MIGSFIPPFVAEVLDSLPYILYLYLHQLIFFEIYALDLFCLRLKRAFAYDFGNLEISRLNGSHCWFAFYLLYIHHGISEYPGCLHCNVSIELSEIIAS
jgi:hypothetical protein